MKHINIEIKVKCFHLKKVEAFLVAANAIEKHLLYVANGCALLTLPTIHTFQTLSFKAVLILIAVQQLAEPTKVRRNRRCYLHKCLV